MNRRSDAQFSERQRPQVQPPAGIPAGPLDGDSSRKYRAAVIRPKPVGHGEGTLRLDAAEESAPNLRHAQRLDDYVNWLNSQVESNVQIESNHQTESASVESTSAESLDDSAQCGQDESRRFTPMLTDAGAIGKFFSSRSNFPPHVEDGPSTDLPRERIDNVPPTEPTSAKVRPVRPIERLDQPHVAPKTTSAAHIEFPCIEEEQMELQAKLLQKKLDQLSRPNPGITEPVDASVAATTTTTDELVAQISSAIASVLNNQPQDSVRDEALKILEERVHREGSEDAGRASAEQYTTDIHDEMIHDIVRQRMVNPADKSALPSSSSHWIKMPSWIWMPWWQCPKARA